jgi:uncharacterized metal-binding protein
VYGWIADQREAGLRQDPGSEIVTVDGCPFECSRKIVEQSGFKPTSIVLTRNIGMKKKGLSEDIGKETKGVMTYISDDDVKRAKELIVKTIQQECE